MPVMPATSDCIEYLTIDIDRWLMLRWMMGARRLLLRRPLASSRERNDAAVLASSAVAGGSCAKYARGGVLRGSLEALALLPDELAAVFAAAADEELSPAVMREESAAPPQPAGHRRSKAPRSVLISPVDSWLTSERASPCARSERAPPGAETGGSVFVRAFGTN